MVGCGGRSAPPITIICWASRLFEPDPDVIANAADRQIAHVRTFQAGPHAALAQRLLGELAAARVTLLDPQKRAVYDAQLRAAAKFQLTAAPR